MKKILSTILALTLVLSMSVPAYAEVLVDGTSEGTGPVTHDGDAHSVEANASGDKLTVNGSVIGTEEATTAAVIALNGGTIEVSNDVKDSSNDSKSNGINVNGNGSTVNVGGDVSESGNGNAVNAIGKVGVTIEGNVTEKDAGYAIGALTNVNVLVNGNVEEEGADGAINASNSTVTVKGNVTESGDGNAIEASGDSTVTVILNVSESGDGNAIKAKNTATVIVGGNVSGGDSGSTINAQNTAKVIVEGLVAGDVNQYEDAEIFIGQLDGNITGTKDNTHYLIGTAAEGSVALNAINLISDIVAAETIDGVTESGYKYTTTADTAALSGKTITLKPADGKILAVSGYDSENVSYVANADGTVTFTIGDEFKGGLQNLVLVITDKPTPSPDPDPTPTPKPDPQPTPAPSEPDPQPTTPVTSPVQYTETGNPVKNYVANDPTGSNIPLPYITTNGEKAGWQTIDEALDAHKANCKGKNVEALSVTMNGSATVDMKLITDAHDKQIPLSFVLDDEVTVGIPTANSVLSDQAKEGKATYFKVSSMTTAEAVSVNKADAGLLPSDLVAIGGNENTPVVLTLCSNDKLSTDKSQLMTISFNASKAGFKKGDTVYLYCGTSQNGIAMYKSGKVDKNGLVTFSVPMVSNYWTIGSTNMGDKLFRNN